MNMEPNMAGFTFCTIIQNCSHKKKIISTQKFKYGRPFFIFSGSKILGPNLETRFPRIFVGYCNPLSAQKPYFEAGSSLSPAFVSLPSSEEEYKLPWTPVQEVICSEFGHPY